ncbi:hypothetical protein AVEN_184176-1 [Araneus ventricosus]|uniref:Uncharacterized protein n=1 Tax=Araneus ventricosus TaxID=182803 RepID=A0A4Y2I9L3_ARAVE|nr:hypothetical protein AVEN_184176-1 [Araneus ventricosus]
MSDFGAALAWKLSHTFELQSDDKDDNLVWTQLSKFSCHTSWKKFNLNRFDIHKGRIRNGSFIKLDPEPKRPQLGHLGVYMKRFLLVGPCSITHLSWKVFMI